MKTTNAIYKLLPSLINISLTFILSSPSFILSGFGLIWKLSWIAIFLVYNLIFELSYKKRDPGMILVKTYYDHERTIAQKLLYACLYTLSFSTLIFYIWFPFDLLLINLVVIQLPFILKFGNTFHGFLSGNVKTIKMF